MVATRPVAAGPMADRVRIERPVTQPLDAYGNERTGAVSALGERWCRIRPEFGREQMEAGRLESTTRAVVTLRRETLTDTLTAADRLAVTQGPLKGRIYNIRSITPVSMAEIELAVEEGVAT